MISHPQWMGHEPYVADARAGAYIIECPTCGYEPEEQVRLLPMRCPKCHAFTWHRLPRPGMLGGRALAIPPGFPGYVAHTS
jgi:hypothetical protein